MVPRTISLNAASAIWHNGNTKFRKTEAMEDFGYTVIRFGHADDWAAIVARFPYVFGQE
jgi:hypothetical protein